MKKTFLMMLMAGSSMAMFAQTTPTTPTTPTTTPTTPTTNSSNTTTTNSTTDPMNTVTNPSLNNNTVTATGNTMNNGSWNNGTPPSWTWRSYGIWEPTIHGSVNTTTTTPVTGADLSSTNSYSAYSPVENVSLPYMAQMNYSKEYPMAYSSNGTWSQYGDWFYTTYMNNGRYSQIFYDQRGRGYSVALPVLNTYVPENVVNNALQRYGSNLYSITMLKASDGRDAYQVNLLDGGQSKTEWLDENGVAVADVYRVDNVNVASTDMSTQTMTTTDANAAMDSKQTMDAKKVKTKILNEDGSKTKIKTKNGKTKVKEIPATTQNQMDQQ